MEMVELINHDFPNFPIYAFLCLRTCDKDVLNRVMMFYDGLVSNHLSYLSSQALIEQIHVVLFQTIQYRTKD